MAFGSSIELGNIKENWLFKLANNNSGFLFLAFADVIDSSNYYRGVILNRPTISETISLTNSTASTSGISITIPDFDYNGDPVSKELFGGTNEYINRECTIHSKINEDTPVKIGSFRVISINTNGNKINIKMNSHRPWDLITLPNVKTTDRKMLVPIAYGDYTKNSASTVASPQYVSSLTSYAYRPVEYNKLSDGFSIYPTSKSGSDSELAVYNEQFDVFVPTTNAQGSTVSTDNANHAKIESTAQHIFKVSPNSLTPILVNTDISTSNLENIYDGSTSTFATFTADFNSSQVKQVSGFLNIDTPEEDQSFKKLQNSSGDDIELTSDINSSTTSVPIDDASDLFVGSVIKLKEEIMVVESISTNTLTVTRGAFNTTAISHNEDDDVFTTTNFNILNLRYQLDVVDVGGSSSFGIVCGNENSFFQNLTITASVSANTVKIPFPSGTKRIVLAVVFIGDGSNPISGTFKVYDVSVTASRSFKTPPRELYVASDGDTHSITGLVGNAITSINNIHLALLNRFSGVDVATNPATNIDGFSALETDRSDWGARLYFTKEQSFKKILEKLQFEGCFIYRLKQGDSTQPQYIHVKDSYSSGEITTLSKNDISNVSLSHTSVSDLVTKFIVNYQKHPATNEYRSQETFEVSSDRTKYNIGSLENIKTFNLDYLVEQNDVQEQTNPNDSFINYYHNLLGTPKLIIGFTIVHPKYYDLEVGSIINFDNTNMYPSIPFGVSNGWSDLKFMITKTGRTIGKISVTARQIS